MSGVRSNVTLQTKQVRGGVWLMMLLTRLPCDESGRGGGKGEPAVGLCVTVQTTQIHEGALNKGPITRLSCKRPGGSLPWKPASCNPKRKKAQTNSEHTRGSVKHWLTVDSTQVVKSLSAGIRVWQWTSQTLSPAQASGLLHEQLPNPGDIE